MSFIHYQPPIKRSLPGSLRHKALEPSDPIDNLQKAFTAPELSDEWPAMLLSSDHIEDLDLSGPAIEGSHSSCYNTKPNLSGTTQIHRDPLRESDAFLSSTHEEHDVFEAWLCDAGATHQGTDTGRATEAFEDSSGCVVKNDDKAIQAKSDSKPEESGETPFKASIFQATPELGVSAGIGTRTIINAVPGTCVGANRDSSTDTRASNGSTYETDTSPSNASPNPVASAVEAFIKRNSSTDGPATQRWCATQVDATGEQSHSRDGDSNCKDDVHSRSLIKPRHRSTIQKHPVRRRTKRHRFSSPLSSTEGTETDNGSDTLNCASPKALNMPKPQSISSSISSGSADPARTSCDQSSPMMVVYEQQSWEGMIIEERYMKQKRGRSRKQYLVRWKDSWVDYSHLPVPKVLQSWKAGRAAQDTLVMQ